MTRNTILAWYVRGWHSGKQPEFMLGTYYLCLVWCLSWEMLLTVSESHSGGTYKNQA